MINDVLFFLKTNTFHGMISNAEVIDMLIDELKKANVQALKDHDSVKRAALSVLINKYMLVNIENRKDGKETSDADVVSLIQKVCKELEEEKEMYVKAGREDSIKNTQIQIDVLSFYLPKMLSEDEIKNIISGLEDKSMKNVMSYFKSNYAGKVDMSLVSKIARGI